MVKILVQILSQVIGSSETLYPPLKDSAFPVPSMTLAPGCCLSLSKSVWLLWNGESKFRASRGPWKPAGSLPTSHHARWGLIWTAPSPANHKPRKENDKALWKIQSLLQIVFCFPSFFIFTGFIDIHDFFTDVLVDFGESLCNFSFIHSFLCYSVIQTL